MYKKYICTTTRCTVVVVQNIEMHSVSVFYKKQDAENWCQTKWSLYLNTGLHPVCFSEEDNKIFFKATRNYQNYQLKKNKLPTMDCFIVRCLGNLETSYTESIPEATVRFSSNKKFPDAPCFEQFKKKI